MTTTTFTVTLPDGTTAKRTSKTKVYTHAVVVFSTNWNATEPSWGVLRWSQSEDNAERAAASFRRDAVKYHESCSEWASARVVEVDQ